MANLKRGQLRRQFGLFGWIHMSLLLVIVSSHFIVNNILEVRFLVDPRLRPHAYVYSHPQGLIWFWVPCCLVIMNDIAAYVCGTFIESFFFRNASSPAPFPPTQACCSGDTSSSSSARRRLLRVSLAPSLSLWSLQSLCVYFFASRD